MPNPAPPLDFQITLDTGGNPQAGIELEGSYMGISIEMSLAEAISQSYFLTLLSYDLLT